MSGLLNPPRGDGVDDDGCLWAGKEIVGILGFIDDVPNHPSKRTMNRKQRRLTYKGQGVGRWKPYQHLLEPLIKELDVELDEAR